MEELGGAGAESDSAGVYRQAEAPQEGGQGLLDQEDEEQERKLLLHNTQTTSGGPALADDEDLPHEIIV
jgi:hypothetical protein